MTITPSASSHMPPPNARSRSFKPLGRSSTIQGTSVPVSTLSTLAKEPVARPISSTAALGPVSTDFDTCESDRVTEPTNVAVPVTLPISVSVPGFSPSSRSLFPHPRDQILDRQANSADSCISDLSSITMPGFTSSCGNLAATAHPVTPVVASHYSIASSSQIEQLSAPPSVHLALSSAPSSLAPPVGSDSPQQSAVSLPHSEQPALPAPAQVKRTLPGGTDSSMTDFIRTLREEPTPTLYKLPRHELECLVAEIVREDGFLQLVAFLLLLPSSLKELRPLTAIRLQLESLDSMWRVKAFVGIES